jgi:hypothetical protein
MEHQIRKGQFDEEGRYLYLEIVLVIIFKDLLHVLFPFLLVLECASPTPNKYQVNSQIQIQTRED